MSTISHELIVDSTIVFSTVDMDQSGIICQHCWKNARIVSDVFQTNEDKQVHVALQVCAPTKTTSVKCCVFLEIYLHLLQTNLLPKRLVDEAFGLIENSKQKTVGIKGSTQAFVFQTIR